MIFTVSPDDTSSQKKNPLCMHIGGYITAYDLGLGCKVRVIKTH